MASKSLLWNEDILNRRLAQIQFGYYNSAILRCIFVLLICGLYQGSDIFVLSFCPVLRLSTNAGQWKEAASKVTHALVNIR